MLANWSAILNLGFRPPLPQVIQAGHSFEIVSSACRVVLILESQPFARLSERFQVAAKYTQQPSKRNGGIQGLIGSLRAFKGPHGTLKGFIGPLRALRMGISRQDSRGH